jgi:hypothetical protein
VSLPISLLGPFWTDIDLQLLQLSHIKSKHSRLQIHQDCGETLIRRNIGRQCRDPPNTYILKGATAVVAFRPPPTNEDKTENKEEPHG